MGWLLLILGPTVLGVGAPLGGLPGIAVGVLGAALLWASYFCFRIRRDIRPGGDR